jgi:hypothetical protein
METRRSLEERRANCFASDKVPQNNNSSGGRNKSDSFFVFVCGVVWCGAWCVLCEVLCEMLCCVLCEVLWRLGVSRENSRKTSTTDFCLFSVRLCDVGRCRSAVSA